MIETGQLNGEYLLKYGGYQIPFRVSFNDRKKLTIHVYPEMRVEVLAPVGRDLDVILARVQRRSRWIVRQWRYFEQFQPKQPDRRFLSGETHPYLGRHYRLKVIRDVQSDVKLVGQYFVVRHATPEDSVAIQRLLDDWYVQHAKTLFLNRVVSWLSECRPLCMAVTPTLTIRKMSHRWGSCTRRGTITLNVELIKVPLIFIDYVIVHELCHLKIHSHSDAFYRLLTRSMPDWRRRKERLDSFAT
jgi:predicted metal-dependent hydrolase